MTAHSRILGRAQESQNDYDFNAKGTDYKLTTYVEVREATGEDGRVLDSILWVEARFSLKQAGATRGVNVGHVYAKKVDKTVLDAGVPVWLSETLTEGAKKDKEIGELSTILQELYDEDGDVHDQIKNMVQEYQDRADSVQHQAIDVKADLKGESILFVDTLLLDGDFRGTGLSKVAMQAFHRLLPRITNGHSYTERLCSVQHPAVTSEEEATRLTCKLSRRSSGSTRAWAMRCG